MLEATIKKMERDVQDNQARLRDVQVAITVWQENVDDEKVSDVLGETHRDLAIIGVHMRSVLNGLRELRIVACYVEEEEVK